MSIFKDQHEFLKASDCADISLKNEQLYSDLINEEFKEFVDEEFYLGNHGTANSIKEALDLIYVAAGYLNVTIGHDKAQQCWDALQANNMSKTVDGKLVKNEFGKTMKPEGYVKLDLSDILG
jgi:hypothetical protein